MNGSFSLKGEMRCRDVRERRQIMKLRKEGLGKLRSCMGAREEFREEGPFVGLVKKRVGIHSAPVFVECPAY